MIIYLFDFPYNSRSYRPMPWLIYSDKTEITKKSPFLFLILHVYAWKHDYITAHYSITMHIFHKTLYTISAHCVFVQAQTFWIICLYTCDIMVNNCLFFMFDLIVSILSFFLSYTLHNPVINKLGNFTYQLEKYTLLRLDFTTSKLYYLSCSPLSLHYYFSA